MCTLMRCQETQWIQQKRWGLIIVNNKQVVVHNDHLPFIQSYNTKDISQISPRLRRIYLELAEHDIALTWKPGAELVHVLSLIHISEPTRPY